ncbi:MAG: CBS domain-containing protein [Candidatus Micrarchaeia archaeon]
MVQKSDNSLIGELSAAKTMSAQETVARAISKLSGRDDSIIVVDGKKYVGIVDEGIIQKLSGDLTKIKLGTVAEKVPPITDSSSIEEICTAFYTSDFRSLPVISKGVLRGVLTRLSAVKLMLLKGIVEDRRASEIMTSPPVMIEETATVAQAKAKMRDSKIQKLVVVSEGKLRGLLSIYDLTSALSIPREKPQMLDQAKIAAESRPISPFITPATTVAKEDTLKSTVKRMLDAGSLDIVVVEDDRPIGIITSHDIFRIGIKEKETDIRIEGLPESDRIEVDNIKKECRKTLSKIERGLQVQYLKIHIKKKTNRYIVNAKLKLKSKLVISEEEGYKLIYVVRKVLSEILTILRKGKRNRMHVG